MLILLLSRDYYFWNNHIALLCDAILIQSSTFFRASDVQDPIWQ
jgi:hypothetical protein